MYINKAKELIVLIYINNIFIVLSSKKEIKWFKKKSLKFSKARI